MALDSTGLVVQILAYRHIFHFRRDDSFLGIMHLGDAAPLLGATGLVELREADGVQFLVVSALTAVPACYVVKQLGVVALRHPGLAHTGQSFVDVGLDVRVGVGTGGVVDGDILVGILHTLPVLDLDGGILMDAAHSHADIRT